MRPLVLHDPACALRLADHGIQIPVLPARDAMILAHLRADPLLAAREAEWLRLGPFPTPTRQDISRVHDPAWAEALLGDAPEEALIQVYELRNPDGSWNRYAPDAGRPLGGLVPAILGHAGGTLAACRQALAAGFACFLGGGMHHAMRAGGRGFCPVNDMVVALRRLQAEGAITRAWVVDVDAHKGDGTAELTAGDDSVLTLSVHMHRGWPLEAGPRMADGSVAPWWIASDVDVPVGPGGEASYLPGLEAGLARLLALSGGRAPDLCVVVAGSDPYALDELPSAAALKLPLTEMVRRDLTVHGLLARLGVPQAWVLSGGYGANAWRPAAHSLALILTDALAS